MRIPNRNFPGSLGLAAQAVLLAVIFSAAADAATFSVTPSTVSNTFVGTITLQIGGLTNGETVFVDHYVDLNTNGVLDAADFSMEHFTLTDGQRSVIGGITNLNVPGDSTATDAVITTSLNLFAPTPQWPVGIHLLRLSSPSGRFGSITNRLTITNWPYAQSIGGVVKSGATNVPNALVEFLSGANGGISGGTVADNSGNYFLRTPPGSGTVVAFKSGYVMSGRISFSVPTNTAVTTNLTLLGATRSLSGRVMDSAKTNIGLPGILIFSQAASGNVTGGTTDTNGNFTLPATSDIWKLSLKEHSGGYWLGYTYASGNNGLSVDTTTGSVSTAYMTLTKGSAMFYGRIKNNANVPMPGVKFSGNDQYVNLFGAAGWSDTNGNYTAATTTNNWSVQVSGDDPIFRSFVVGSGNNNANLSSNQAVRVDFTAVPSTGVITGKVSSVSGPVAGLLIFGNSSDGINNYQSDAVTDANGNYFFSVFNANWNVQPNCNANATDSLVGLGYNCTAGQNVNVSTASTRVDFFVYPLGTAVLSDPGWVGPGQFGLTMSGTNGGNYYVQASTNLSNWATISNFILSGSSNYIEDDDATNDVRFYRAVKQ